MQLLRGVDITSDSLHLVVSHRAAVFQSISRVTAHIALLSLLSHLLSCLQELHKAGFEIHAVPRGGETTYHGPGQLVAYPIVDLRQRRFGARAFVEGLEDAMIHTAGCFGIQVGG